MYKVMGVVSLKSEVLGELLTRRSPVTESLLIDDETFTGDEQS